jgi:hypothetical protein
MTVDVGRLVGAWELERWETRYDDGRAIFPMGEDARGHLLYTADGHMSAFLMRANRPSFVTGEALTASDAEKVAAWNSFYAYAGRFEVSGDTVVHHVYASLYPNWVGQDQPRLVRFEGERLLLTTLPQETRRGVQRSTIRWRRPMPRA